jgi:PAS domain S-box-containing protein
MRVNLDLPPERDQLFEQLFEASSNPAFIVDPFEDRIIAVNQAGCAMLGYTHEEMLATPVSQVHPAELPQFREFLGGVLHEGQGSRIKLTCRTKDGTFLPTEMALVALESGGRTYLFGLVHDRSEHRQRDPGA